MSSVNANAKAVGGLLDKTAAVATPAEVAAAAAADTAKLFASKLNQVLHASRRSLYIFIITPFLLTENHLKHTPRRKMSCANF